VNFACLKSAEHSGMEYKRKEEFLWLPTAPPDSQLQTARSNGHVSFHCSSSVLV
jgi:hypothetical protein